MPDIEITDMLIDLQEKLSDANHETVFFLDKSEEIEVLRGRIQVVVDEWFKEFIA